MNVGILKTPYRIKFPVFAVIALAITASVLAAGEDATVEVAVLQAHTAFFPLAFALPLNYETSVSDGYIR